ncbi:cation diffusion facilitator family transporter [Nesterenkonia sp. AN1]|uniref:Cobalt-zinc-cadmium efflux system protein n=1 Tax=Nesterenkonia aurantiaca TaxID=1436010 RepID=A0A4R7FZE8_9MICC|nr:MULTISPECIES: cation diffusion facilitator family transporter [Nesterenkonia]EXF25879.1 cation diffusion facilitator family transporter [Nesterenkonia sp. AN1]TDS84157.1 cobalt-zinc-cadmium efflux system protein [Nesterenkonia aurantiaca]
MHHHDHGASTSAETPERALSHRRRLAIACAITVGIVLAQALGAWMTGSLALLTDAVHSLTDSIGLGVALVAAGLMHRAATAQRTWGFRRVEILAGLLQATLLLGVGIYAAVEGIGRLSAPPVILHLELLIFGALGLAGNVISLLVLASGRKANFNMRAAFLEVSADALGSLAVMLAAVVIWTTGWQQADAVAALAIAALIIPRALLLLRETARVLLEFTPRGLDLEQVRAHMLALDHVQEVHDLHASTVATGLPVISAHVVLDDACFSEGCVPETLNRLKTCVAEHFDVAVEHSTFQLEPRSIAAEETHTHA